MVWAEVDDHATLSPVELTHIFFVAAAPGLAVTLLFAFIGLARVCTRRSRKYQPRPSDSPVLVELLSRLQGAVLAEFDVRLRIRATGLCVCWAFTAASQNLFIRNLLPLPFGAQSEDQAFILPAVMLDIVRLSPAWRILLVLPYIITLRPTDSVTVRLACALACFTNADYGLSVRAASCPKAAHGHQPRRRSSPLDRAQAIDGFIMYRYR